MLITDLEQYLTAAGHSTTTVMAPPPAPPNTPFVLIKNIVPAAGTHVGKAFEVAIPRTAENPWVPQRVIHVRPHGVEMGKCSSQASVLGADWQYLSRRFDRPPTPKTFLAHILKVLEEL
jgi:hypothetical protein